MVTKNFIFTIMLLSLFSFAGTVYASEPFGPPQPLVRESGGLRTSIGYWFEEDRFGDDFDYLIRQNRIYSEAAYGTRSWEVYGRIGIADLEIPDAYGAAVPGASPLKTDFKDSWSLYGTLGGKIYHPFNHTLGMGTFFQLSYTFSDYHDAVSGTFIGAPFTAEVKIKNSWNAAAGIALQANLSLNAKVYAGPFFYYAEKKVSPSAMISGLRITAGDIVLRNKTIVGGFAGIDLALYKPFHLTIEAQYSERLNAGAAISFIY